MKICRILLVVLVLGSLQACSGAGVVAALTAPLTALGGGSSSYNPDSYTVSGTVSGLEGNGLVLRASKSYGCLLTPCVSAADTIAVGSNGSFTVTASGLPYGNVWTYSILVTSQPSSPSQSCAVSNGSGSVSSANVTNVQVRCTTNHYNIGGSVSGLMGTGLVLQINGGDSLTLNGNGAFSFPGPLASGASYEVTVQTQPTAQPPQTCTLTGGTGTVTNAPISTIVVTCPLKSGRFLYVPNFGSNNISAYTINATTGALTPMPGSPFAGAGSQPQVAVTTPDGRFLYVAGGLASSPFTTSLAGFAIDPTTGALTPIPGMPAGITAGAPRLFLHPSGNYLYVQALGSASGLYGYRIDPGNGALTPVPGSPMAATFMNDATFDMAGNVFYVSRISPAPLVLQYSVNGTTGALAAANSIPVSANPAAMLVDPSGRFLYVSHIHPTLPAANVVSAFSISATTGVVATVAGSPFPAGQYPTTLLVNRTGQFLYAVNNGLSGSPAVSGPGSVSAWLINGATGALIPSPGSPIATGGANTRDATIDPTGRYLVATNSSSGTVAMFGINASTGALTHATGSPMSPAVGISPGTGIFDPSGRFMYLDDAGTNSVSSYALNATTGALTLIGSSPAGTTPATRPQVAGLQ